MEYDQQQDLSFPPASKMGDISQCKQLLAAYFENEKWCPALQHFSPFDHTQTQKQRK